MKGEDLATQRIVVTTLGDLLLSAYDKAAGKEALVFPEGRISYDQLVQGVMAKARGLAQLGVKPGDHVGVLLPSGIGFVETLFANAMIGAVSVLMNARYKAPEMAYVAANADLTTIVTDNTVSEFVDFGTRLRQALPGLGHAADPLALDLPEAPRLRRIIQFGGEDRDGFIGQRTFDLAAQAFDEMEIHRRRLAIRTRDIAMILYTSGTSANPKGCLLTHEAVTREAINLTLNRWGFSPGERAWSPLPLFHIAAMLAMLGAVAVGGTFIGQPHFDAGESLRQVEQEKVTMMFLPFVTFHQAMIAHPDWAKTDLSSVRLQNSCFAFMPDSVGQAYREKAPNMLQVGTFGMTEATGIVTTGGYDMDPDEGFTALGYPLTGISVRVIDEHGNDLPAGQRGEVLIRGYSLFEGYFKDAEKTAEVLDADGWYHSGDIGSINERGHLMFHGRFKDMLKVGGENVAAAEVEAVLAAHPSVRLAQVVGLPDPRLEEIPAAWIEPSGVGPVDEAELIAFAKERLASFKVPRHIRVIEEWPMSASKIQKFKLRQALINELGLDS
jgi:acyl-CoA synthetase (AMP-forming)/AMP-acid ligase II